eukprot:1126271-Amphidinium_carterae.2
MIAAMLWGLGTVEKGHIPPEMEVVAELRLNRAPDGMRQCVGHDYTSAYGLARSAYASTKLKHQVALLSLAGSE